MEFSCTLKTQAPPGLGRGVEAYSDPRLPHGPNSEDDMDDATLPGNVDYNPYAGHGTEPSLPPQEHTPESNQAKAEGCLSRGRSAPYETSKVGHSEGY